MSAESADAPTRLSALDGLRGIAALIVVAHHVFRVIPDVAVNFLNARDIPPVGSWLWWLQYSPLKILTAGPEAVLVFFVLSGFVLALAPFTRDGFDWVAYMPRRVVRLFVPTIAAVLFAAALIVLVPRYPSSVHGPWLAGLFDVAVTKRTVLTDASILFGEPFRIDGVMWSLVWEVWFSLLLPLFIAVVVLCRRFWWVSLIIAFGACVVGELVHQQWLIYLPVFLFGVGLARGAPDLRVVAARITALRFGALVWWGLLALGMLAIVSRWLVVDHLPRSTALDALALPITAVGAALVTAVCAFWVGSSRFLTWRPVAWLGRVSFSLYLVHLPIVLSTAFLIGDEHWLRVAAISVPLSLLVAWGFYKVVESPAHRLSVKVGRMTTRAWRFGG